MKFSIKTKAEGHGRKPVGIHHPEKGLCKTTKLDS